MIRVNLHEAKTRLSALVAVIEEKQETIRLCRNGKAVAAIVPLHKAKCRDPLQTHPDLACIQINGDLTAPVTEEEWPTELR